MSKAQWTLFLSHSLATRLDASTFKSYTELLSTKHPLLPLQITELFLAPTENNHARLDPRIPRYLQVLLELGLVNVPSILTSLRKYSTFGTQTEENSKAAGNEKSKDGQQLKRWTISYAMDEILLYKLTKYVSSGTSPKDATEAAHLLLVSLQWMKLVTTAQHGGNQILNLASKHLVEMNATTMALGTLIVAVIENAQVIKIIGKDTPKGAGKDLSETLENFVPLLMQTSPQIEGRIELFRTQNLVAILPVEKKEKEITASKEIDEMLEVGAGVELDLESIVVADLPTMNSRAGLYIYLNSLVC
jgi:mediator of RNA polymerase II transcription subunit 5